MILAVSLLASSLAFSQVAPTPTDVQDVQNLMNSTEVSARYNYCIANTLTCRQLVMLKDKTSKVTSESFADVFMSAERAVGSTGYFLKNANGSFRAILDDAVDGVVLPNKKFNQNQALTVSLDSDGLPTIHGGTILRVGTTRYIIADMAYSTTQSSIIGTEYDSADSSYAVQVSIIYARVP